MDEHQGVASRVLREVHNIQARSFTPEFEDPQGTQHPADTEPHEQTWESENVQLAAMGQQLYAFAQANHTHMRTVKGGRQALARFAAECDVGEDVTFPSAWTKESSLANRTLEKWIAHPSNPFGRAEETDQDIWGDTENVAPSGHPARTQETLEQTTDDEIRVNSGQQVRKTSGKHQRQSLGGGVRTSIRQRRAETTAKRPTTQDATLIEVIRMFETRFNQQMDEIKSLKTQNDKMMKEIKLLREQITQEPSQNRSWAAIAATNESTAQRERTSQSPSNTNNHRATAMNQQTMPGIVIDLTEVRSTQFDKSDVKAIRERVRQAFDSHNMTRDIGLVGIARLGGETTRVKVCMRTHEEVRVARIHNEWLGTHFQGARMQGAQWHAIKVDRVSKYAICDESQIRLRPDACARLGEENGIVIKKMQFVGRQTPDKRYCSVVIYVEDKQEADRLLDRQTVEADGEIAFTRQYEQREPIKRCYKCQKYRHEAYKCPDAEQTCGNCAEKGHTYKECQTQTLRCANCGGGHRSNDRGCTTYQEELKRINSPNE